MGIIAEGGQAFRWNRIDCNRYVGVVDELILDVEQQADMLIIDTNGTIEDISKIKDYFDLDRDYHLLEKQLSEYEEIIPAVKFSSGSRILHQDPWETAISFIISANNNIRNIKNTIERICMRYGSPIYFNGNVFYSFPTPSDLANTCEDDLRETKCGYRAKYIKESAKMIADGIVDIYELKNVSTEEGRKELMKLPGVGRKVADCIMLFSMRKFDVFPIDIWIKRIMEHIYFDCKDTSIEKIQEFAHVKYGNLGGFVQQYLFHFGRLKYFS